MLYAGIPKATPSILNPLTFEETTPTTVPSLKINGPPLFPPFTLASVCINFVVVVSLKLRIPEIIP
jgi:hypothetical protein